MHIKTQVGYSHPNTDNRMNDWRYWTEPTLTPASSQTSRRTESSSDSPGSINPAKQLRQYAWVTNRTWQTWERDLTSKSLLAKLSFDPEGEPYLKNLWPPLYILGPTELIWWENILCWPGRVVNISVWHSKKTSYDSCHQHRKTNHHPIIWAMTWDAIRCEPKPRKTHQKFWTPPFCVRHAGRLDPVSNTSRVGSSARWTSLVHANFHPTHSECVGRPHALQKRLRVFQSINDLDWAAREASEAFKRAVLRSINLKPCRSMEQGASCSCFHSWKTFVSSASVCTSVTSIAQTGSPEVWSSSLWSSPLLGFTGRAVPTTRDSSAPKKIKVGYWSRTMFWLRGVRSASCWGHMVPESSITWNSVTDDPEEPSAVEMILHESFASEWTWSTGETRAGWASEDGEVSTKGWSPRKRTNRALGETRAALRKAGDCLIHDSRLNLSPAE